MRYLADLLTLVRIILGVAIFGMAVGGGKPEVVLILFLIAELTDAFDGTCARKWPFRKGKEPKYRKYAVKCDMMADAFLWFVVMLFITLQVNLVFGLIMLIGTGVIAGAVELVVYGKFFGHPDDCRPNSLCQKDFPTAKKIVMLRRNYYLFTIFMAAIYLLVVTKWDLGVKVAIAAVGALVGVFLWFFLKQRRENISRDAVEVEKKLTDKAARQNSTKSRK